VYVVGFILRIFQDARSPERQIFVRVCFALAIIGAAPTGLISITFDTRDSYENVLRISRFG